MNDNAPNGGEIHAKEAVEEKVSLSDRFGLWLSFYPFDQNEYLAAVESWLAHFDLPLDETAHYAALNWAQMRGNRFQGAQHINLLAIGQEDYLNSGHDLDEYI